MKLGVVYGVHGGDEQISVDIGRSLEADPINPNRVFVCPGNEEAIANGGRFKDENLSASFNSPDLHSSIYERRRAAEILGWCAHGEFDLILEIHATRYEESAYAGIGVDTMDETIAAARFLGFSNLIVSDYGLPPHFNNAVLVEVPQYGTEPDSAVIKHWRNEIRALAEYDSPKDLYEDYATANNAKIWVSQDALYTDGVDVELALSTECADSGFVSMGREEIEIFGLTDIVRAEGRIPYAINVGSSYLRHGMLGEYVYFAGTTKTAEWRETARMLVGTGEARWAVPEVAYAD